MIRKARVDNRRVYCPNASHLGYDLWFAKRGNFIVWQHEDGGPYSVGRSLGRIAWAEPSGDVNDTEVCSGYIAVLAFTMGLDFGYIRWVKPSDVRRTDFLRYISRKTLPNYYDVADMADYGSMSDHYVKGCEDRLRERKSNPAYTGIALHGPQRKA